MSQRSRLCMTHQDQRQQMGMYRKAMLEADIEVQGEVRQDSDRCT